MPPSAPDLRHFFNYLNAGQVDDVLPSIPKLKSLTLSEAEDEALTTELEKKNRKKSHDLTIYPNGWIKVFGIKESDEIEAINERIITRVREREAEAREKRIAENKTVLGVGRLKSQPIMKPHTPPPRKRRVYMLSSVLELRVRHAAAMKKFVSYCKRCYQEAKAGKSDCQWPPGAIRPWLPPVANPIVDLETLMFSLEI